jgi:transcription elongation factor Elf1
MMRRACPRCNSTKVILDAAGTTGNYRCMNCGYVGPMIIETEFNERKLDSNAGKHRS